MEPSLNLRCKNKLHGIIVDSNVIEILCKSQLCKHDKDEVVLHRFNTEDGSLIETLRYRKPKRG